MNNSFTWTGVLHAGIASFLRAPVIPPSAPEIKSHKATHAIYGIPFDSTTITRSGSMHGPRAIRDASSQYLPYHFLYDVDISESINLIDCGDAQAIPGSASKTFMTAEKDLGQIYKADAIPLIIGGEHSVTIAGTTALSKAKNSPLGLVVFDAHMDTATDIGGELLTHCAPVSRTLDLESFSSANTVIIGVNGPANPLEERIWLKERGITMFTILDIMEQGIEIITKKAMEIAWKETSGVYVSVDIDCLDGAYAPGTCAPEPGGLTSRELLQAISIVGKSGFSAFDVVEIAPQYDQSGITARIACRVILDLLAAHVHAQKAG